MIPANSSNVLVRANVSHPSPISRSPSKPINQPDELARHMARIAHNIRSLTIAILEQSTMADTSALAPIDQALQQASLPDLTRQQLADVFAQTLVYGLFAAHSTHNSTSLFSWRSCMSSIFSTYPLLKILFDTIIDIDQDNNPLINAIEDLLQVLEQIDIHTITADSKGLIHFYEMFLAQYNPQLRELHSVYYTPQPIISYIVRSVDLLLQTRFDCQDGLADISTIPSIHVDEHGKAMKEFRPRVVVLDPSCGTGAFLHGVLDHIRETYRRTGNTAAWQEHVRDHLPSRLFGFEVLIAPYLIAHFNLAMQLDALDLPESERNSWAYDYKSDQQFGIYLTNTLENIFERGKESLECPIFHWINDTSPGKQEYPVMVVLGNPPYAGHSTNKGKWITELIETYKEGCPELKKPAQAKWLNDDYVKFIRFAQWQIEHTGQGILAFITNHGYLDNPTFRGMRRSLMQSFNEIYILDLHGNSKKKESLLSHSGSVADGLKDENVFDIQQGVAISIFVKSQKSLNHQLATIYHADLWGRRETYALDAQGQPVLTGGKYAWLAQHDIGHTPWRTLNPQAPLYLFAEQNTQHLAEYDAGWKVPDIFQLNGDPAPGIVTTHDEFAISWSRAEAISKVEQLLATNSEDEARQLFRLCTQDQWQYSCAKKELADGQWRQETVELLYRPFDKRWTVFNRHVAVHRRERVMRHMLAGKNLGITIGRAGQVIHSQEWDIVFCTRDITEYNLYRRGGNNLFPLYLYPNSHRRGRGIAPTADVSVPGKDAYQQITSSETRQVNLAPEFISDFSTRLGMKWVAADCDTCDDCDGRDTCDGCGGRENRQQTFGPEDVLAYMYAIFYSPSYRQRYAEFLKIDFPRLPLTSNIMLFRTLCKLGKRLIELHLMEMQIPLITSYPIHGNNKVEKVHYIDRGKDGRKGQVWINKTQYFEGVPSAAWTFHIGGYQVCQKWLKDRKGRALSSDEVLHYQRIVAILTETSRVMKEIDEVIEQYGGWPIDGKESPGPQA